MDINRFRWRNDIGSIVRITAWIKSVFIGERRTEYDIKGQKRFSIISDISRIEVLNALCFIECTKQILVSKPDLPLIELAKNSGVGKLIQGMSQKLIFVLVFVSDLGC